MPDECSIFVVMQAILLCLVTSFGLLVQDQNCSGSEHIARRIEPLWTDTCAHLRLWEYTQPQNTQDYKEQYDTLKLYVEKCAAIDKNSWDVFTIYTRKTNSNNTG